MTRSITRTTWIAKAMRDCALTLVKSSGVLPPGLNGGPFGKFENPRGYALVKLRDDPYLWIFRKAIYEFTLNPTMPLTFLHPDGVMIQPDRHQAETDMGSTPASMQLLFPKDRFLLSYLFHDSGYRHGGLYMQYPNGDEYQFCGLTRAELDDLLRLMVRAEGGCAVTAGLIYNAVRIGGGVRFTKSTGKTSCQR